MDPRVVATLVAVALALSYQWSKRNRHRAAVLRQILQLAHGDKTVRRWRAVRYGIIFGEVDVWRTCWTTSPASTDDFGKRADGRLSGYCRRGRFKWRRRRDLAVLQ